MMKFLSALTALVVVAVVVPCGSAAEKPNVIFLFADDMRADSIGALGNPTVKTPNLDSVVKRGFAMRNAYCFGGNSGAVCTPSRNMLLSGNVYFRWKDFSPPKGAKGLISPGDGPNFPLSMKDAGYVTYHHGKRGNTAPLIQAKFDENRYLVADEAERRSGEPGKEIVDSAIGFLEKQAEAKEKKPFFMYLAFGNPHDPRVAAPSYLKMYDRDKIPLPKNFKPQFPYDIGSNNIRDEQLLPWPRTEDDVRRTLHEYYAVITALDHHIGRLLKHLETTKQLDNTIILFSADQGIAVGSHGLLGKQNLYDHSMKSPLFFAGPGIKAGESKALVYLFDIYPTVCDLVGAAAPKGIDGVSFRPILDGKAEVARKELMLAYLGFQRAYRDGRWKLLRYPEINITQLFDLHTDPDELNNLADKPDQQPRVKEMLQRLVALQKQFGDERALTVANPKSAEWTPPKKK